MSSDLQEIFKLAAKHVYKIYKKKGGSQGLYDLKACKKNILFAYKKM